MISRLWPPALLAAALLGLWQLYASLSGVSTTTLPPPTDVATALWEERSMLGSAAATTSLEIVVGLLIAVVVGVCTGIVISRSVRLGRAAYPLLIASQTVPVPAIAPLVVLWLGFDFGPKIVLIALVSFFPVTVATIDGLRSVDRELLSMLRTMGAGRKRTFLMAEWPGALPRVMTGVKTAAVLAPVGAVFAEWVGASDGLGYLILIWNNQGLTAEMLAAVAVLGAIGLALFGIVLLVGRALLPWQRGEAPSGPFISL